MPNNVLTAASEAAKKVMAVQGVTPREIPSAEDLSAILEKGLQDLIRTRNTAELARLLQGALAPPQPPHPLEGLRYLREAGLDLGTISTVQKDAVSTWQGLAQAAREEAKQAREEARQADDARREAEARLVAASLEKFAERVENAIKAVTERQKDSNQPSPPDPVTAALQEAAAKTLGERLARALAADSSPAPTGDPVRQLESAISLLRVLDGLVAERARTLGTGSSAPAMTARDFIEMKKLEMQMGLETAKFEEERKRWERAAEERRAFAELLRDAALAVAEAFRGKEHPGQAPAPGTQEVQPPPPKLEV